MDSCRAPTLLAELDDDDMPDDNDEDDDNDDDENEDMDFQEIAVSRSLLAFMASFYFPH